MARWVATSTRPFAESVIVLIPRGLSPKAHSAPLRGVAKLRRNHSFLPLVGTSQDIQRASETFRVEEQAMHVEEQAMHRDILSAVSRHLTPDLVAKMASASGISDPAIAEKAVGAAVPAVLARLA